MRNFFLIFFLAIITTGCMTRSSYKEAEPRYQGSAQGTKLTSSVVIFFEPVIVGKRFDEVVCDNVFGAFWSPSESTQIGFTQNNAEIAAKVLPLLAFEASLGRNIGGGRVASGQSSIDLDKIKIDSRIMVPFGSYISRSVEQLMMKTSGEPSICFDAACVDQQRRQSSSTKIATVRFTKFRVAEDNPNKLTLIAEGVVSIDNQGLPQNTPIKYEIIDRSISSEGYTHASFLRVMDKAANELASGIADQLLHAIQ